MISKAHALEVDQVLLDLEDGVAPEAKIGARTIISAQKRSAFRAPTVSIRVNALESSWFADDMELLSTSAGAWIDSIILPKLAMNPISKKFLNFWAVLRLVMVELQAASRLMPKLRAR